MIVVEQARTYPQNLGLDQSANVLDSRLDNATSKQLAYAEFLADLPGMEAAVRPERYLATRIGLARFPYTRTLEQFDFKLATTLLSRFWGG